MAPSVDWFDRAACRTGLIDMVPQTGEGVLLAKKMCARCPVTVKCLLAAERLATLKDGESAQGVWGGLTAQERGTMAVLGRLPEPCDTCGLDCVPINLKATQCSSCKPAERLVYDDYRMLIELMVRAGASYKEIGLRLRLNCSSISSACKRWKVRTAKRSVKRNVSVMPCGTLAAKYRHHRLEKRTGNPADGFRSCPECRFVSWKRGRSQPRAA